MHSKILFSALCLFPAALSVTLSPVLQLKHGQVQGILQRIDDENNVQLYLGIRYAVASRFRRPRDPESWNDVYNATMPRFVCPQPEFTLGTVLPTDQPEDTIQSHVSSEDCLFLNVWRPTNDSAVPRPILVWLYDDDYISGTIFSDQFDGRYLSYYGDVIVVTVQYRLNAFGFLYGDDDAEPGNLATYDQIAALKWIQDNAAVFGGDKEKVTIFGGTPVGLLLLTSEANDLFNRAILQSGPVFGPLGIDSEKQALVKTRMLGALVNCTIEKFEHAVACMRNVSADTLVNATESMAQVGIIMRPLFDDDHVFEKSPIEQLLRFRYNQKVDLLYGVNANESSPGIFSMFPRFSPELNETVELDDVFNAVRWIMQMAQMPYMDEVLQRYTESLSINSTTDDMRNVVAGLHSDLNFVCPTILFGQQIAQSTPARHYYSYYLADPTSGESSDCADWMGVCYQQEISHIFGHSFVKWPAAEEEISLSRAMIDAWTNFARNGAPGLFNATTEWTQAWDGQNFQTLVIQPGAAQMETNIFANPCSDFWRSKFFSLYRYSENED